MTEGTWAERGRPAANVSDGRRLRQRGRLRRAAVLNQVLDHAGLRIDDADFAAAMRKFVEGEVASSEPITLESHRRNRTWLNRLRWAIGYFIVAVADYRIAKRLNFKDVGLPRP